MMPMRFETHTCEKKKHNELTLSVEWHYSWYLARRPRVEPSGAMSKRLETTSYSAFCIWSSCWRSLLWKRNTSRPKVLGRPYPIKYYERSNSPCYIFGLCGVPRERLSCWVRLAFSNITHGNSIFYLHMLLIGSITLLFFLRVVPICLQERSTVYVNSVDCI